jgi:hypothetical protein
MARRFIRPGLVGALATLCALVGVNSVIAAGYWNVPSHFCQWLGSGFGGGYHAPLMLGPPQCDCFRGPNEVRLPCAPNPYACQPTSSGGCGGYGGYGGYQANGPMMMTPSAQPMMQPVPEAQNVMPEPMPQVVAPTAVPQNEPPASEPRGALFAPPVEE